VSLSPNDGAGASVPPASGLIRAVAFAGVPLVIAATLAISFLVDLSPLGRLIVVSGGGVAATVALIAPWLLSRRT
jgi:hypothetical protein